MYPSLRRRLLVIALTGFSVAWIIAAAAAYFDVRVETERLLDGELEQVAQVLMALSQHELKEEMDARGNAGGKIIEHEHDLSRDEYDSRLAFQVWLNGNLLALRSSNAPESRMSADAHGFSALALNKVDWRVYSLTDPRTGTIVHVGEDYSMRQKLVDDAASRTIVPLLIVVPVIGVLAWLGIGRALQPLRRVAEHVAGRNPYDLSPIDDPRSPQETKPLIDSLNRLFGRLNLAFENTRRFTADAAHELRTPLAGIAAQTDVALLVKDEAMRTQALVNTKTAVKHMTRLVQQLMTLARWDSHESEVTYWPVDLAAVTAATVRELEEISTSRNIRVTLLLKKHAILEGDETGLQLIARNLVDNALRYTPPGGSVTVEVGETEDFVRLKVTDSGPGIAPEQRDLIFQRFYRGSQQHIPGSGLGLSIVQRCVEMHRGTVELDSPVGGGLSVTVRLPKYQSTSSRRVASVDAATEGAA